MEKVLKRERGITLVALVVTIIILLILAGVAIRSVTGENGLFQKAKIARVEADISEVIDNAKMDIMTKQIEKVDGSITEGELKTILEKYGDLSEEGEASILDKKLTTDKGRHEIEVRRIYDGSFGENIQETLICKIVPTREEFKNEYGETVSITLEQDMKWNTEFLDTPLTDKFEGLMVGDIVFLDIKVPSEFLTGTEIYSEYSKEAKKVKLHAYDVSGNDIGVVHWEDEVLQNITYRWVDFIE